MPTAPLEDLLRLMIDEDASDLHVSVGIAPVLRIRGSLVPLNAPALTPGDIEALARAFGNEALLERVVEEGSADFAFSFREQRYRISLYRERGNFALVARLLPSRFLTLEEIGVPPAVANRPRWRACSTSSTRPPHGIF